MPLNPWQLLHVNQRNHHRCLYQFQSHLRRRRLFQFHYHHRHRRCQCQSHNHRQSRRCLYRSRLPSALPMPPRHLAAKHR